MSLPAALVSFLFSAAPAHADLKLCNRMSYVIEAAIGIDDKAATATRGWFRIDPATCRVVVQGALTADRVLLNARALGVYGASPIPQNGTDTLCVAQDNFVIAAARQCRSGQTQAQFTQITPTQTDDGNLVAYLAELPERQLRGVQMGDFYDARGHKDVIQKCRVGSCKKGVTSLCRAFPTLLAYRYVDGDVLVMRAVDVRTSSNVTTRLASAIAMANDRDDEGQAALKAIDDMLAQLKLELGSMNKLKKEVEERGICLRNGRELGDGLRRALRSGAQPTVNRHLAKDYAFAKKCLIVL